LFRADFTTFRTDQRAHGEGVFICVKNYTPCAEVWVDDDFEMDAVEYKAWNQNICGKSQAFTEFCTRTCG
jgi:hypothetical protein